jgi:hypothetical protein
VYFKIFTDHQKTIYGTLTTVSFLSPIDSAIKKQGKREQGYLEPFPPFSLFLSFIIDCFNLNFYLSEITVPSLILGNVCGAAKTAPGKTLSIGSWK